METYEYEQQSLRSTTMHDHFLRTAILSVARLQNDIALKSLQTQQEMLYEKKSDMKCPAKMPNLLQHNPKSHWHFLKNVTAISSTNMNLSLRSRLPCTDPKSGLRPEMEKNDRKMDFGPTGKMAEKWRYCSPYHASGR